MSAFASLQCLLGLLSAFLLELPSVISIEVDHASRGEAILLAEHVAEVDLGVRFLGVGDRVAGMVGATDRACPQIVCDGLARVLPLINLLCASAEKDVNSDLRLVVDKLFALGDGVLHIDVRGG